MCPETKRQENRHVNKQTKNTGAREILNRREFQGSGLSGTFCTKSVRHKLASLHIRGGLVSKIKINLF